MQAISRQAQQDYYEQVRSELQDATQCLDVARRQSERASQELTKTEQRLHEAREQSQQARRETEEVKQILQAAPAEASPARHETEEGGQTSGVARQEANAADTVAPTEATQQRLIRSLNDAWAVEQTLADALQDMAEGVTDPDVRGFLEEHRRTTHRQQENLEARLRALGQEPSGGKGFFNQMVARAWDALHRPQDGKDKTLQDLLKVYGTEHLEIAMYEAMAAFAGAVGDDETVRLAADHLRQEQGAAERLRPLIAPAALQVARALRQEPEPAVTPP